MYGTPFITTVVKLELSAMSVRLKFCPLIEKPTPLDVFVTFDISMQLLLSCVIAIGVVVVIFSVVVVEVVVVTVVVVAVVVMAVVVIVDDP